MAGDLGRIERELACVLTDEEVQSRARLLAETVTTMDEVQAERTGRMKEFKDRLTGLNEQQRKLSRVICDRSERRMVLCAVRFHLPVEGLKRVVRMDTGEVVGEEPMSESERQLHLFAAQQDFATYMESQGIAPVAPADPVAGEVVPLAACKGCGATAPELHAADCPEAGL